jgi:hypothetical protein
MSVYALNPKWYMDRPNRVLTIDDEEVEQGFRNAINTMYTHDEANVTPKQFIDFGTYNPAYIHSRCKAGRQDLCTKESQWIVENIGGGSPRASIACLVLVISGCQFLRS